MARRTLLRAAALVACLGLAGCSTAVPPPPAADAAAAPGADPALDGPPAGDAWLVPDPGVLAAWERFPAGARPRPLVISTPPRLPDDGFTGSDAKEAALAGRFRLAATLPSAPPPTMRVTLPDGPAELPTLTAEAAVDSLSAASIGSTGPELPITRVALGTATFSSDRGPLPLPAWLFTVDGATGPIAWPALADPAFWPREPSDLVVDGGAHLGPDGRTLAITLPAPPEEGCPGGQLSRYEPAVLESAAAVVVGLRSVPSGVAPGSPEPCAVPAVGRTERYTVPLASPLGGRVLLAPIGVGYTEVQAVVPG